MDKEGRGEVGKGNEERGGKGNGGWDVKKINKRNVFIYKS